MLPLILLAGGAYLIGKAVLEDDKYAEGGMITSISEAKKVVGNVEKSNNEHFSWFVPDIDYEGEDYDQEYGVHLTDSDLMQLANELKGGYMAKGGDVRFYEGQSVIYPSFIDKKMDKSVRDVHNKFANKELVIDKITIDKPFNTAKVLDRNSGEKAPFDLILDPKYVEQYAKGGKVEGKSGSKYKIEMFDSYDDIIENKKPARIVYSESVDVDELRGKNISYKLYKKWKGKYMNISTYGVLEDIKFREGGEVKDYSGNYYSTYDFVAVNKLEKEADSLFGKDWEAEDDASQILELTDSLGGGYTTYVSEDDEDWQRLRYKHSLNNETNDSNYDIFVVHYGRKKKK